MAAGSFTIPDGEPPLEHRARQLALYGALTYDMMCSDWCCPSCQSSVAGPPAMLLTLVKYRTVAELEGFVAQASAGALEALAQSDAPECSRCGGPAELHKTEYFAHSSALRADVVVRWSPSGVEPLVLWSPAVGFAPLLSWTEDDDRQFSRDALWRGIAAARELEDEAGADQLLLEAVDTHPGDSAWLTLLPWLTHRGKLSVAGVIAAAHADVNPSDPDGHFWLGQLTVDLVVQKLWGDDKLSEAEVHFQRALACKLDHPFARLGLANIARVRGDLPGARELLEQVLALTPDHPESLYTLGLIELEANPDRALSLFERGATFRPRDADFPRGMARALLALHRPLDAQAAAVRAKGLAPHDQRIDEILMAALAASRP